MSRRSYAAAWYAGYAAGAAWLFYWPPWFRGWKYRKAWMNGFRRARCYAGRYVPAKFRLKTGPQK